VKTPSKKKPSLQELCILKEKASSHYPKARVGELDTAMGVPCCDDSWYMVWLLEVTCKTHSWDKFTCMSTILNLELFGVPIPVMFLFHIHTTE